MQRSALVPAVTTAPTSLTHTLKITITITVSITITVERQFLLLILADNAPVYEQVIDMYRAVQ